MIRISSSRFVDEHNRTLILRGVNLGGSSKVPRRPNGATYLRDGFFEHRNVSFVGRPFPLAEADEHFSRLRAWGFKLLRFLTTWEAIEHAGPGIYDEDYLDYFRAVAEKAADYGFSLWIDPHQDVWNRFSGGDGAPGWTFEAVGLDLTKFQSTGAAVLHQLLDGTLPRMIWPSNETKLAAATMFTLFFGGNDFAPTALVEGEPVQEYLQRHYIAAIRHLAERLAGLPNILGYDTLNEPLRGYIGWEDLRLAGGLVKAGPCPSPFQAMLLGAGYAQAVETWEARTTGFVRTGSIILNESRISAWLPGRECIWMRSGVWEPGADGEPRLLRPGFFAKRAGRPIDFSQDYFLPFARRFADAIHTLQPKAVIFLESATHQPPPRWNAPNIVYAPHWYDGFTLFLKRFSGWLAANERTSRLILTPWLIRRSFAGQLEQLKREADERLNGAPALIGEFGIPMDLQGKRAFRTGDFRAQEKALDRTFRALDDALLGGALWNYTADNTNEHGDLWNDEDLSLFSHDQQRNPQDIHSGGRALGAVVRPYARAIAGTPLRMGFDHRRRRFKLIFRHDPGIAAPTEIFIPEYQYPSGYRYAVSDGDCEQSAESKTLLYRHTNQCDVHTVEIRPI